MLVLVVGATAIMAPMASAQFPPRAEAGVDAICWQDDGGDWHAYVMAEADAWIVGLDPAYTLWVLAKGNAGTWRDFDEDREQVGVGGSGRDYIWVQVATPSGHTVPAGSIISGVSQAKAYGTYEIDSDEDGKEAECGGDPDCETLVQLLRELPIGDDVRQQVEEALSRCKGG